MTGARALVCKWLRFNLEYLHDIGADNSGRVL